MVGQPDATFPSNTFTAGAPACRRRLKAHAAYWMPRTSARSSVNWWLNGLMLEQGDRAWSGESRSYACATLLL